MPSLSIFAHFNMQSLQYFLTHIIIVKYHSLSLSGIISIISVT